MKGVTLALLAILTAGGSAACESGAETGNVSSTITASPAPTLAATQEPSPESNGDRAPQQMAPCTAAGCQSGVEFDITSLGAHEQPLTIEACVSGICRTATYPSEEQPPDRFFVEVSDGEDGPGTVVPAQMTVTGPDGEVVAHEEWSDVPLHEQIRPNGASCPPICHLRRVRLEA